MTGRMPPAEASAHATSDALLPWFVNGTLDGEELAFVSQHVDGCAACQREAAWLRDVYAACAAMTLADERGAAGTALGRPAPAALRPSHGWRATPPWVRGLMAAQLAAIAVLGTLVAVDMRQDTTYRTLGEAQRNVAAHDTVAVIFDRGATAADLQRIVAAVDGRIVDGPTMTDAFIVELPAGRAEQALATLRAERTVRFAERLGPGTPR